MDTHRWTDRWGFPREASASEERIKFLSQDTLDSNEKHWLAADEEILRLAEEVKRRTRSRDYYVAEMRDALGLPVLDWDEVGLTGKIEELRAERNRLAEENATLKAERDRAWARVLRERDRRETRLAVAYSSTEIDLRRTLPAEERARIKRELEAEIARSRSDPENARDADIRENPLGWNRCLDSIAEAVSRICQGEG